MYGVGVTNHMKVFNLARKVSEPMQIGEIIIREAATSEIFHFQIQVFCSLFHILRSTGHCFYPER